VYETRYVERKESVWGRFAHKSYVLWDTELTKYVLLDLCLFHSFAREAMNDILSPELKFFMVAMQLTVGPSGKVSYATPGPGSEHCK
jgi:hypothetical protein